MSNTNDSGCLGCFSVLFLVFATSLIFFASNNTINEVVIEDINISLKYPSYFKNIKVTKLCYDTTISQNSYKHYFELEAILLCNKIELDTNKFHTIDFEFESINGKLLFGQQKVIYLDSTNLKNSDYKLMLNLEGTSTTDINKNNLCKKASIYVKSEYKCEGEVDSGIDYYDLLLY